MDLLVNAYYKPLKSAENWSTVSNRLLYFTTFRESTKAPSSGVLGRRGDP